MTLFSTICSEQSSDGLFYENNSNSPFLTTLIVSYLLKDLKLSLKKISPELINKKLYNENNSFIFFLSCFCLNSNQQGPRALVKALDYLTILEVLPGGPYRSSQNNLIDLADNYLINCFLKKHKLSLPSLEQLINNAISNNQYKSDSVCNELFLIILIMDYASKKQKELIINYLLKRNYDNSVDICLASISLIKGGYFNIDIPLFSSLEKNIALVETGKEKVSTSNLIIMAIYLKLLSVSNKLTNEVAIDLQNENKVVSQILKIHDDLTISLNKRMKENSKKIIMELIEKEENSQMMLMPLYIRNYFPFLNSVTEKDIAMLGLMNTYFWCGFIIYDDFWDVDEKANPLLLPIANFFTRKYIEYFQNEFSNEEAFLDFFSNTMEISDSATYYELSCYRLKRIKNTILLPDILPKEKINYRYWPAAGHLIPSLSMLIKKGYAIDSCECKVLIKFFKNYLIGRQINDDISDWEEDLASGKLTIVTIIIINAWREKFPNYTKLNIEDNMDLLKALFWKNVHIPTRRALSFYKKAKYSLSQIRKLNNENELEKIINNEESVLMDIQKEQSLILSMMSRN